MAKAFGILYRTKWIDQMICELNYTSLLLPFFLCVFHHPAFPIYFGSAFYFRKGREDIVRQRHSYYYHGQLEQYAARENQRRHHHYHRGHTHTLLVKQSLFHILYQFTEKKEEMLLRRESHLQGINCRHAGIIILYGKVKQEYYSSFHQGKIQIGLV